LADTALACFKEMSETDPADALSDLLANLMHWAEAAKLDFDQELARAKFNYQCERVQEKSL
jgi:hypothetical protein